ncbi:squamosa promoter binding protein [Dorcoceras hygrometricum]|uniref:Squamosa promoter binding protein n=1 Tax=Dorcoceras hygrometricum TaxID=472368 RepID=A0A2Z7BJM8_9LAMI|nr:squamosa promoter binding protein [Dorcoceras hygrometricum]
MHESKATTEMQGAKGSQGTAQQQQRINEQQYVSGHGICSSHEFGLELVVREVGREQQACCFSHELDCGSMDLQVIQLDRVERRQMPPRRGRGRTTRQAAVESRAPGSDEDVEQSVPLRHRAGQVEVEVDNLTR